ncbi:MAG: hypothetical protein HRT71_12015 [Flavobacteriales bacterium]|nr:hypothetical protein [Flavobacteriales bacterium]
MIIIIRKIFLFTSFLFISLVGFAQEEMLADSLETDSLETLEEEEAYVNPLYIRHTNYIGEIVSYQSLFYNGQLYNDRIEKKKGMILNNRIKTITKSEYRWTDDFEADEWYKNSTQYYNEAGNLTRINYRERDRKGRINRYAEEYNYKYKTNCLGNLIKKIVFRNDTFYEEKIIAIDSLCRIYKIDEPYADRHVDSYYFNFDKVLTRSVTLGGKYDYYYEYEYDKQNNLEKFTTRNKDHHIISIESYKNNTAGQVVKKKVQGYDFKALLNSAYVYNKAGFLLSETRSWVSGKTKLKGTITYEYDDLNNVIRKVDDISNQLVRQKADKMTSMYLVEAKNEQRKDIPPTVTTYEYQDESDVILRTIVDQHIAKRKLLYEYEYYPPLQPLEEEEEDVYLKEPGED